MHSPVSLHTLRDRYVLNQRIGHGGTSSIYRALDLRTRDVVAIKRYDQRMQRDTRFVAHFRGDARRALTLDHPHVLRTLGYGFDGECYYLVTDYMGGGSLDSYLHEHGDVPPPDLLRIVSEVCEGLECLHSQGVLHHNLKPSNILLEQGRRAVLSDAGPAFALGGNDLALTLATLGAVAYYSPEQVLGHNLTPATDIYALGVVLYLGAAGCLPFHAANPVLLAQQHLDAVPAAPRTLNPAISPDLEAVILRCLEKDPTRRYSSAADVRHALSRCDLPAISRLHMQSTMASLETDASIPAPVAQLMLSLAVAEGSKFVPDGESKGDLSSLDAISHDSHPLLSRLGAALRLSEQRWSWFSTKRRRGHSAQREHPSVSSS